MLDAQAALGGQVNLAEIDCDENAELARSIPVPNIPLVAYYRNGKLVAALVGGYQNVLARLERVLRGETIGYDDGYTLKGLLGRAFRLCAVKRTITSLLLCHLRRHFLCRPFLPTLANRVNVEIVPDQTPNHVHPNRARAVLGHPHDDALQIVRVQLTPGDVLKEGIHADVSHLKDVRVVESELLSGHGFPYIAGLIVTPRDTGTTDRPAPKVRI
jgi:hypothetical protein